MKYSIFTDIIKTTYLDKLCYYSRNVCSFKIMLIFNFLTGDNFDTFNFIRKFHPVIRSIDGNL